jgi:hypothetical protein
LRRPADGGTPTRNDDRAFDQARMGGHGRDQSGIIESLVGQAQLTVLCFAFAEQFARTDAELAQDGLELGTVRRVLQLEQRGLW